MHTNRYYNIKYNKKNIKILQYESESNTQFKKRLEFIKLLEKKNIYYTNVKLLSLYWYCITYLHCKYDIKTMDFFSKFKLN